VARLDRLETVAFDFIDGLKGVEAESALLRALYDGLSEFGFTSFLITGLPHQADEFEAATILNGWPNEWYRRYMSCRYYESDAVAVKARTTLDPFYWSDVDGDLSEASLQRRIMHEAAELGLRDGLLIPVYGARGEQYCVTMAGRNIDRRDRVKQAVHLMALYAHSRAQQLVRIPQAIRVSTDSLTAREKDCLQWVAVGKSDWEIGEILGISVYTVNAHLRKALTKLNAANRTHAVVKALQQAMISI
jgi:LuxR family transcriptional regulator, quorum-sensing system regulator BjaR1